ncbi:MAG: asparagine synthase C-terminal domain-containing protein, partial [Flavobacteriaceae bacterium]
ALLLTVETLKNSPLAVLGDNVLNKLEHTNPFLEYINESQRFNAQDLVQKMLLTDTQIILPSIFLEKVDKSTMGQSIEVRVPLLDNELTDFVIGLPSSYKVHKKEKKWLLRQALRGVVPNEILDAPKTGFGVPFENWLKKPLNSFMKEQLFSDTIRDKGFFNEKKLRKIITQHEQGKINHGFLLWKLMNLSIWMQKYKVET